MQKFSLHTHTSGFDGANTEEEMILKARELGWTHIGFSNHFIVHPNIKKAVMYSYALKGGYQNIYSSTFDEAIAKFIPHYQRIDKLQKESDIKILKGMEVDFFANPQWQEGFNKALEILKPDYLIGSAHFIEHKGMLYNSHDLRAASPMEQNLLLHRYWQNERAAAQSGLFTFLAHLDLMKKVNLGQGNEWIDEELQTIQSIKNSGTKVELNTSYFKFGNEPYPSQRIIKMLAQANVPVLISDDAHKAEQLGNHFAETLNIAKDNGIINLWNPFEEKNMPAISNLLRNINYSRN